MNEQTRSRPTDAIALVANYESDVGYAWWLMENFWSIIAYSAQQQGRRAVLAYPRIGAIPEIIRTSPIEVTLFRFARDSWSEALATAKFLKSQGVRSVYLTDWPYLHWSYLLWRLYGVRRIVIHDHTPGVRPRIGGLRGVIKRALFALRVFSADQYAAVSKYVGERHLNNACIPAQLDVVVENGIVPFDPAATSRAEVRTRLGIPHNAFLIVLVSRATYYKGLDQAVRCVASLLPHERDRPIYAVHCGDGPDLIAFRELASSLQVSERFTFLGRRSDVREILAAADVAFHPSRGEAMCLSILEFMCAALPVVVPNNPSVSTSIDDGVSGLVFEAGNDAAATAALRSLYEDEGRRATIGRNARRICLERYLLEHTNAAFTTRVVTRL